MLRPLLFGSTALLGACAAMNGGDGGNGGPTAITVPDMAQRVTGIFCTAPGTCLFGTDATDMGSPTHLYLTDGKTVTATLVTSDMAYASKLNVVSAGIPFGSIQSIDGKVYAEFQGDAGAAAIANGDPTQPSSWGTVSFGSDDAGVFGLNQQVALAHAGGTWTYFISHQILEASAGPASSTTWTPIWAPQASPPIPADIDQQRTADPTLCDTEPYVGNAPPAPQMGYVAPDRSMIAYPAGGAGVLGDDAPGMCISTDGGHSFHLAAIAGVASGPRGVACTSKDHCVAYTSPMETDGQADVVWISNDASKGVASTWTAASLPMLRSDAYLTDAFFAADATHGWMLGYDNGATALLLATTDGGATWTDVSDALGPHDDFRPWAGTAIDASHILVGGETVGGSQDDLFALSF